MLWEYYVIGNAIDIFAYAWESVLRRRIQRVKYKGNNVAIGMLQSDCALFHVSLI